MPSKENINPLALLLLRLVLGTIMIAHGWMKVHHGMAHHVQFVHSLGMPGWLAYASAGAEFGGGILLIPGLLTRLASLFIAVNMLVAIFKVLLPNGLLGHPGKPGYDFPLALLGIALSLFLMGAGSLSIDARFRGHGARGR